MHPNMHLVCLREQSYLLVHRLVQNQQITQRCSAEWQTL